MNTAGRRKAASLDEVDRTLIRELIADGRATYAKLAPIVGLSPAAVRTRVQRLLDERLVVVTGRVDPAMYGLGVFAFAFAEVSDNVDKVAACLAEIPDVVFLAVGSGRFDLLIEIRCPDSEGLLVALDRLRGTEGVRRVQSATVLHYDKQDWSGIGDRAAMPQRRPVAPDSTEIDDIDRRLLWALIADGRSTYASLASTAELSQAAVRDRVIDLMESNVIAIAAHPDAEAMGIGGFAGIGVKASGPVAPIIEAMVQAAETTLVARTLGRFDVTAEVWFDDYDHLAELLDRLRALRNVGTIDTLPYLRIAKEEFGPPQRL